MVQALTSTTAPSTIFATRGELADHYKSDWHKYNCKRKEAGLPMLNNEDFQARLEAALAVRREQEQRLVRDGTDHLKGGKISKSKKKQQQQQSKKKEEETVDESSTNNSTPMDVSPEDEPEPVIDPNECPFDGTIHDSPSSNMKYMKEKFSFFLPDKEYCVDMTGLLGYCNEKVQIGYVCLYCQKAFGSTIAVRDHMVDSRHQKLRYEEGVDLWEFEPFYDFSEANIEYEREGGLGGAKKNKKGFADFTSNDNVVMEEYDSDDSGEWEDVSDDEDDDMDIEGYQQDIKQQGFDVTPLGELIFPDGRIVGHRALSKYYKQRLMPETERAAVIAARKAAGERRGVRYHAGGALTTTSGPVAGVGSGAAMKLLRQQNGVLVRENGATKGNGGPGGFTALSLYRYKAVLKKARREEFQGMRLKQRTTTNMNRMDKKWNRLHNNVSVAHAKR